MGYKSTKLSLQEAIGLIEELSGMDDARGELLRALRGGELVGTGNRYRSDVCSVFANSPGTWGDLTPDWWATQNIKIDWKKSRFYNHAAPPGACDFGNNPDTVAADQITVTREAIERLWRRDSKGLFNNKAGRFTTAYLEFIQQATSELGMSPDKVMPKKNITDWLKNNWPPELGECSERIVETMATIMREPEDRKGGFLKEARERKGDTP